MLLNGVIIQGREPYQTYFSYEEVMAHLDRDPYEYLDMVRSFSGSKTSTDAVLTYYIEAFLLAPELPEAIDGVDWLDDSSLIDSQQLTLHARQACHMAHELTQIYPHFPGLSTDADALSRSFLAAVEEASLHYTLRFPPRAALETELLLHLHIQADQAVSEAARQAYCQRINKLCFSDNVGDIVGGESSTITLPEGAPALTLPLYTSGKGPLSIVQIINSASSPVQVSLAGTTVSRTLQGGEHAFVLRKAGAYVDFLPQFTLHGHVCFSSSANGLSLYNIQADAEDWLPLPTPPSSWAITKEHGTLLVSPAGQLHEAYTQLSQNQPIVHAQACGYHYGLLTAGGELLSDRAGASWADLIGFAMDRMNFLGIASDRTLVSALPGIAGRKVLRVCLHGEHYLWLDTEGCVHSDAGIEANIDAPVSAIALCEAGYVAALPNQVIAFGFDGKIIARLSTDAPVEDLAADGSLCVLRQAATGNYAALSLAR